MEQNVSYIVSVTNGDKEYIVFTTDIFWKYLLLLSFFLFADSLLGFTYLVIYGVIVEVIVLLAVYYGYSEFQGIIL